MNGTWRELVCLLAQILSQNSMVPEGGIASSYTQLVVT
jgi:hypothetical protein